MFSFQTGCLQRKHSATREGSILNCSPQLLIKIEFGFYQLDNCVCTGKKSNNVFWEIEPFW